MITGQIKSPDSSGLFIWIIYCKSNALGLQAILAIVPIEIGNRGKAKNHNEHGK